MRKAFKLEDSDSLETFVGGLLSIIVIVAAIVELFINGISAESVISAVKDIAGTLITFVLLVAFIKNLPTKPKSFRGKLEEEMKKIEDGYAPMIQEHVAKEANESEVRVNKEFIRYDIAKNIGALYGEACNDYIRFFELKAEHADYITFYIRKKFFGDSESHPYDPKTIAEHIAAYMNKKYTAFQATYLLDKDGAYVKIGFNKILSSEEDIAVLSSIVDDALMLYIAECKK